MVSTWIPSLFLPAILSLFGASALPNPKAVEPAVGTSAKPLRVVATIPDLGDIVKQIGGDRVQVKTIAKGRQNTHAVPIQPSDMIALSRADVFVQVGLALEHAWIPNLLRGSRNETIQPGGPGFINASDGWQAIQVAINQDRSQAADVHPAGNPHMNLDPKAGRHFAGVIAKALQRIDPEGAQYYANRHATYQKRLTEGEQRWKSAAKALKGKQIVMFHREFDYLLAACGIELVGVMEPKPEFPPRRDTSHRSPRR